MKIPGLTTTRLQLLLAALCLATGTASGLLSAALVLAVLATRLLVIRHVHRVRTGLPLRTPAGMPAPPLGTAVASLPTLTHGSHAT